MLQRVVATATPRFYALPNAPSHAPRGQEWTVDQLLSGELALLPFVPFAGDATPEGVDEAITILTAVEPRELRSDLMAALEVFATNVFKDVPWSDRMLRELLMESKIYRMGLEKGEALGLEKGERRLVALLIRKWLPEDAEALVPRLERLGEARLTAVAEVLADDTLTRGELLARLQGLLS